jgi:HEAT repeat protein
MRKGNTRRWGAVAALLLAAGGAAYWWHARKPSYHAPTPKEVAEDGDARRWGGFPAGLPIVEGAPPPDAGPTGNGWADQAMTKTQLEAAMDAWRKAIQDKDADTVMTLDRAFALLPGRYGPQLVVLAESDPDERVRAFSTRVLGKLKNVELVNVYKRLAQDPSPFVRGNAAWAVGELLSLPNGKTAAMEAYDDLRRLEDSDPATEVRAEATNTLKRLQ